MKEISFPENALALVGTKRCRLTILGLTRNKNNAICVTCKCDCGKMLSRTIGNLLQFENSSCGCWRRDHSVAKKHGKSKTKLYDRWCGMVARCHRETHSRYKDWGGKGITVCDRWRHSFENFYADMGDPPKGMTLERKDQKGGYSPENVIWASLKQQALNRSDNRRLTFDGKTLCVREWADLTGINYETIRGRLDINGWSVEKTLTTKPSKKFRRNNVYVDFRGEKMLAADVAAVLGVSRGMISQRIKSGKSLEDPPDPRSQTRRRNREKSLQSAV